MSGLSFKNRNFTGNSLKEANKLPNTLAENVKSINDIQKNTEKYLFNTFLDQESEYVPDATESVNDNIISQITERKDEIENYRNNTPTPHLLKSIKPPKGFSRYGDIPYTKLKPIFSELDTIISKIDFSKDIEEQLKVNEEYSNFSRLTRLLTTSYILYTTKSSVCYTFRQRVHFSSKEQAEDTFHSLNSSPDFAKKIELTTIMRNGQTHYAIKWKEEIFKKKTQSKKQKPKPTPDPIIPEPKPSLDTNIDDDNYQIKNTAKGGKGGYAHAEGGRATVNINNDALAAALVKISKQQEKTTQMLIELLKEKNINNNQHNNQEVHIDGNSTYGPNNIIPYYGTIPPHFYTSFNGNPYFQQFLNMMQQQNNSTFNVGGNRNNEVSIMLMMQEMFKNMKLELFQEIQNKYGDINVKIDNSYKKIKKILKNIDNKNFNPEELRKIIQEELNLFKISVVKELKEEIKNMKLATQEDIERLEDKIDTGFLEMKEELKGLKENINKRFGELDSKLDTVNTKIEKIQTDLTVIDGKLDLMGQDITELKNQQKQMLKDLKKLHEEHDKILGELATIKKMIEDCCKKKSHDDDDNLDDRENNKGHIVEQEAFISDVTEISREEAKKIAENELREKYGKMSWLNPKRYRYFYAREYITKNKVQSIMNKDGRKGLNRGDKFVEGAERHGLEYTHKLDDIDNILSITQDTYPITYKQINKLANEFIGDVPYSSTMSKEVFQNAFQAIIEKDPPLDQTKPSLLKVMKENNMQKVSSNIFNQVDSFRANKALVYTMVDYLDSVNPDAETFKTKCRQMIGEYIKDYASMPAFMKRFEKITGKKATLDNPELFKNFQTHQLALSNIQADTLRLNVKLINRGRAAYKVDQEHGAMTKMGKRIERPFAKWIDKSENGIARTGKNTLSILTKAAVQSGPIAGLGMLGGTLVGGPLGGALGVGLGVGMKTLFAKFAQTTKEHEGHLRDQARDLKNTTEYRQRIRNAVNNGEYKRYHKFTPNKKGIEYRNFLRYISTSHSELIDTKNETKEIMKLAQKATPLTDTEKKKLENKLGEALARLDLYKKTGQNFLGTVDTSKVEKEFRDIKKALILGTARLGTTLYVLRHSKEYQETKPMLEGQYNQCREKFQKERQRLARSGAVKTGIVAGGMSYTISHLLPKTETITHSREVENTINPSGNWDPAVNIEKHFIHGDVDTPLRTTMSSPHYGGGKFEITAGVDELAYHNVASAKADLSSKIMTTDSLIKSNFSGTNQKTLLDALNPDIITKIQSDALSSGVDEGNAVLLANRYVEGVHEIAKAHIDSGKISSPITAIDYNVIHQPSVARASGNLDFRTMGVKMDYIETEKWNEIVKSYHKFIPTDWVDNTFKMGNIQEKNSPTT